MDYVSDLNTNGWAFIPGQYYLSLVANESAKAGWKDALILGYADLVKDPYSPGNRFRSYMQFSFVNNEVVFGNYYDYQQTKEYNPDTGGIVRSYPAIHPVLLANPVFYSLIESDLAFAKQHPKLGNLNEVDMGVHLFRYKATVNDPSFSSPIWLHKDDEDLVFVHHLSTSPGALGGDNLIAPNGRHIERVLRLTSHLDTLVVDHQKFHAVTPLGAVSVEPVTRDVILVTFQKRRR